MDKKINDIIANQIKTMTEFNAAEMSVTFRVGFGYDEHRGGRSFSLGSQIQDDF